MTQTPKDTIDDCFALRASSSGSGSPVLSIDLGKYLHFMEPFDYTEEQAHECMAIIYQLMQTAADCGLGIEVAPTACGSIEEIAAQAASEQCDVVKCPPQNIQSVFENATQEG